MGSRQVSPEVRSLSPDLRIEGPVFRSRPGAVTPLVERCFASVMFALSLPALAGAAVAVRVLSRRAPFVALRRVGLHGKPFWVLKLRTMWDKTAPHSSNTWVEYLEETEIPLVKTDADPRVTSRLAAFARRFSLDEVPQLLHVVRSEEHTSELQSQ